MMRALWIMPFVTLTIGGGYFAFQTGQRVTETDVIARYAALYHKKYGGDALACVGQLSREAGVYMRVSCVNDGGTGYLFDVGRKGRLLVTHTIGPHGA